MDKLNMYNKDSVTCHCYNTCVNDKFMMRNPTVITDFLNNI